MMCRTMIAAGLAALALAGPAGAQPAAPPDPERMALAQQIYELMGSQTQTISQAMRGMMTTMMKSAGGADGARQQAVQGALSDSLDKMMPKVLHGTVEIMAEDFTAEELRGMLGFYRSPTGQAVLRKMPAITQQSMRLSLSLMPQMMRDFQADYCARVTCTDKEKAAFAEVGDRMAQTAGRPAPDAR